MKQVLNNLEINSSIRSKINNNFIDLYLRYATPQDYGAITNANNSIFLNDCSSALQLCLDSGYEVHIPNGFYYFENPIVITKPVTIRMAINAVSYVDGLANIANHARFYTDKNIPFLIIRCGNFHWEGGIVDIINAVGYTSDVIRWDFNYSGLYYSIKKLQIFASATKLAAGGYTPNGIHFAAEDALSFKEIHDITLDIDCFYLQRGLYISERAEGIYSLVSIGNININGWRCKQIIVNHHGSEFNFNGWGQSGNFLTYEESLLPAVYNKGEYCRFDMAFYDYGNAIPPSYDNAYFIQNDAYNCQFIGKTLLSDQTRIISRVPLTSFQNIINPQILIPAGCGSKANLWSSNNVFAYLLKQIPTVTVVIYDGTDYDFDTNFNPSVALPSAISMEIFNPLNINYLRGNFTGIGFSAINITDFVEIVIPLSSDLESLFYCLYEVTTQPVRIQSIIRLNDLTNVISNVYPPNISVYNGHNQPIYTPFTATQLVNIYDGIGSDRLIIRLIGTNAIGLYYISDIAATYHGNTLNSPQIDIGGGQTIYGNFSLSGGIPKLLSQATYADNTAAKAGGLVDGDTYRTATGQLMVVYT